MGSNTVNVKVARLAAQFHALKRAAGKPPFILVLGSDVMPIRALEDAVLEAGGFPRHELGNMNPMDREANFQRAWADLRRGDGATLVQLLGAVLATAEPPPAPDGYDGLARLIEAGYFDAVLTADVSTRLEDALIRRRLPQAAWRTFSGTRYKQDDLLELLGSDLPRTKILKLHGDLHDRFAFSRDEIAKLPRLPRVVAYCLGRRLLVVGYNPERDTLFSAAARGKPANVMLSYVSPALPPRDSGIYQALLSRGTDNFLDGEDSSFNEFFPVLSRQLVGGDLPDEVGLDTLEKVGIPVADLPEDCVTNALVHANGRPPLVTFLDASLPPGVPADHLVKLVRTTTLSVSYGNDQRVSFEVFGGLHYEGESRPLEDVNPDELNRTLCDLGRDILRCHETPGDTEAYESWRNRAAREGKQLYRDLFASNPDLMQKLGMARQASGSSEDLFLCFRGPRNHLGMPYELLRDEGKPFVLRHPFYRHVTGTFSSGQGFTDLFADLARTHEQLRVLLVASDEHELATNQEVAELETLIRGEAAARHIGLKIEVFDCEHSSRDTMAEALGGGYHIVHYAGHSTFEPARPEESALWLYESPGRQGKIVPLTARALGQRLTAALPRLVYLSSCVGAVVGREQLLQQDDLGLLDAVVRAGVPVALGYRWHVTDDGARRFALAFYRALFRTQCPARATLHARRTLSEASGTDETYLSPILVAQKL